MKNIGRTIKKIRKDKGVTQSELALSVGISRQQISTYERGGSGITLEVATKIAQKLDISLEDLVKGSISDIKESASEKAEKVVGEIDRLDMSDDTYFLIGHLKDCLIDLINEEKPELGKTYSNLGKVKFLSDRISFLMNIEEIDPFLLGQKIPIIKKEENIKDKEALWERIKTEFLKRMDQFSNNNEFINDLQNLKNAMDDFVEKYEEKRNDKNPLYKTVPNYLKKGIAKYVYFGADDSK